MSAERDELAEELAAAYGESPSSADDDAADHILAAGYRKPRVIHSGEEMVYRMLLQSGLDVYKVSLSKHWVRNLVTGAEFDPADVTDFFPATVLYEGASA